MPKSSQVHTVTVVLRIVFAAATLKTRDKTPRVRVQRTMSCHASTAAGHTAPTRFTIKTIHHGVRVTALHGVAITAVGG